MLHVLLNFLAIFCAEGISVKLIPETGTPPPPRELPGLTSELSGRNLYIYGGASENKLSDMWKFELETKRWNQIYPGSVLKPGLRSSPFMTALKNQPKLVLFGGDTPNGPASDVWLCDIQSESVILIQWKLVDDKGRPPPRAFYRSVCEYTYKGKQYIAVYGGHDRHQYVNSLFTYNLYRLDLETFTWEEVDLSGPTPDSYSQKIEYYEGSIYLFIGNTLIKFELASGTVSSLTLSNARTDIYDGGLCVYGDYIYSTFGVDDNGDVIKAILRVNLKSGDFMVEEMPIDDFEGPNWTFGYSCRDNIMYFFAGDSGDGFKNYILSYDFAKFDSKISKLSRYVNTPPARRGHSMEVFDNKLYIFGGVNGAGKSILDMWSFDLESEDYSPVSIKSFISPSPRSETAHTRLGSEIILFGGKSDTELLNDLYSFNLILQEWKSVEIESLYMPTSRRGSCIAATEDYILIFGGITATGYSNELWKFDWGTRQYNLLNPSNPPPVSAFSQCEIYKSSTEAIFRIYMGETEGEKALTFIYEYNINTNKWNAIIPASTDNMSVIKSAIYLFDDIMVAAGGCSQNAYSYNGVYVMDITTGYVSTVTYLPQETFYAASVFYKDKIYIHGGAESYSWLPLRENVKNDLIVIELNHDCEEESNICIHTCSKGTYYSQGECNICTAGSYSDTLGSNSCKLCPKGYVSNIKGADTVTACKPCPIGYFSLYEGQPRCLECPHGSKCSFYSAEGDSEGANKNARSEQPELLVYGNDEVSSSSVYLDISLGLCYFISILIMLAIYNTRRLIKVLDIYSLNHNYGDQKVMMIRKTRIGGIFSIAFIFAAISIVFKLSISYALDNIVETKALVPLIALEEHFDTYPANEAYIEFIFSDYIGECVQSDNSCTQYLQISLYNIQGDLIDKTCKRVDFECHISLRFHKFDLDSNGSINILLTESKSLSSKISVKIETSSSIPGQNSSISNQITSKTKYFFRGADPCIFKFLMIPSLFQTDTNTWENDLTGYHISMLEKPIEGSQVEYLNLSFVKNLQVIVYLDKNDSVLHTQRLQIQPFSIFMSNLAGAIVGLMGTIKFLMNILEWQYEVYCGNRKHHLNLRQIKQRRVQIIEKSLFSSQMNLDNETPQATARELCPNTYSINIDTSVQYNSFYMNTIKPYSHIYSN